MKKHILLIIAIATGFVGTAQVGINTSNPDPSAVLDISSTTKGLLLPRMNSSQMNLITAPAAGLMVYCTDCTPMGNYQYNNGSWGVLGATGSQGIQGPAGANGTNGPSAYQLAVANGFVGTEAQWLTSLVGATGSQGIQGPAGANGTNGPSAYQLAVANGFVGTEAQWLTSLVGATGPQGPAGADGTNGTNGYGAYAIAVQNGFIGTPAEWLTSLVGATGPQGPAGADGTTLPDADASTKGKIQLAGDLGGTADAPTVPGLTNKENTVAAGTTTQYYRGDKSWQTLDKTAVGLANVDNTSDANKPISTATQTALDTKEATANKSLNIVTDATSDVKFPSVKAVKTYVDTQKTYVDDQVATLNAKLAVSAPTTIYANRVVRGDNIGKNAIFGLSFLASYTSDSDTKYSVGNDNTAGALGIKLTRIDASTAGFMTLDGVPATSKYGNIRVVMKGPCLVGGVFRIRPTTGASWNGMGNKFISTIQGNFPAGTGGFTGKMGVYEGVDGSADGTWLQTLSDVTYPSTVTVWRTWEFGFLPDSNGTIFTRYKDLLPTDAAFATTPWTTLNQTTSWETGANASKFAAGGALEYGKTGLCFGIGVNGGSWATSIGLMRIREISYTALD